MEGTNVWDAIGLSNRAPKLYHAPHHDNRRLGTLYFSPPHNDPLVVELKVANALIRQIVIDIRSFVDIIIWEYLKRLKHQRRKIVSLVHPILGFRGQEVNRTGVL